MATFQTLLTHAKAKAVYFMIHFFCIFHNKNWSHILDIAVLLSIEVSDSLNCFTCKIGYDNDYFLVGYRMIGV